MPTNDDMFIKSHFLKSNSSLIVGEWVLMTEVDLTVKHHTGLFHGSTRPPSGSIISYLIRLSILCICIVEDCVLQLVQLRLSLSLSGCITEQTICLFCPSVDSLCNTSKAHIIRKKIGYSFWNKVLVYCSPKITDNLLIPLQFNNHNRKGRNQ